MLHVQAVAVETLLAEPLPVESSARPIQRCSMTTTAAGAWTTGR